MRHVIIGAGAAGITAAETLRACDAASTITVLDGEGEVPYARMAIPYLLSQRIGEAGTRLRQDPDHYRKLRIDIEPGRAVAIDAAAGAVRLALSEGAGAFQVPAAGARGRDRTLFLLDEPAARKLPPGLARPAA